MRDVLEKIKEERVLKVGTTGDYKPFTYIENGEYKGYDIEIVKLLAKNLDVDIKFIPTTWKKISEDLKDRKYDIAVGGISINLEREKISEMTTPYLTSGKCYLIRRGDEKKYLSIADVNKPNIKIGVNIGGTNEEFVDKNFDRAKIIKYSDNLEVPNAVANEEVDIMITDTSEVNYYKTHNCKLTGSLVETPLTICKKGYMLPKGEKRFLNYINDLLRVLEEKGIIRKLKDMYFN